MVSTTLKPPEPHPPQLEDSREDMQADALRAARLVDEARQIKRVTWLGMGFNVVLAAMKFSVGWFAGSLALVADGFNSLTDIVTDLAVIIGTGMGSRPADVNHPYGHGKIETIVTGIVALGVLGVGVGITWSAVRRFSEPETIPQGGWVMAVAAVTILVKEMLYRRSKVIARNCRSAALQAKAWDHRSDALVSGVVLLGGAGALLGWGRTDDAAGFIVGLVIASVGGRFLLQVFREVTETAPDEAIGVEVGEILRGFEEVHGWHRLRVRRLGRELLMDLHVMLDPELTVEGSHQIVVRLEEAIQERLSWPVNLLIHVDPDNSDIRRARAEKGDGSLK